MSDPLAALRAVSGTEPEAGSTGLPNIPAVPATEDAAVSNFLQAAKLWMEKAAGDGFTGFASKSDLIRNGILQVDSAGNVTAASGVKNLSVPPVPTGLTATGAMTNILVQWDNPHDAYSNHGYTEVWAAETNNFSGAVLVGESAGFVFAHSVGQDSVRYYWLRFVSTVGIKGPYNSVNGTQGQTAKDPQYMLDTLTGQLTESQLTTTLKSRIDLIDGPASLTGSVAQRITAEETARIAAITAEETARITAITAETQARNEAIAQEAYQRTQLVNDNAQGLLEAALTLHSELIARGEDIALAREDLRSYMNAGLSAEASARLTLAASVDANAASIIAEQTARSTADSALATSIDNLTATVAGNSAAISAEQTARANADSAETTARSLLATQMRGSYEGSDLSQITSGLLYQERVARSTETSSLAQQITLISAGVGEQFDWSSIWYFDSGVESWTGNGTPTVSNGWLRPANHATDPYVVSPTALATDGNKYGQVRLRIRKVGTPTFEGFLWWKAASDSTWDAARRVSLTEPTYDTNNIGLITVSPGWAVTVDSIRLDLSTAQDASNYFEIDWVALGRPSPGASSAQLYAEQLARAQADSSEVASREALSTLLVGQANPSNPSLGSLTSGLIYSEREARSTADGTLASSISSLQTTVTNNYNILDAAITSEATARSSADTAETTARESLSSVLTGTTNPTGLTLGTLSSGLIYDEKTTRVTEDQALASSISTLSSTVTSNYSTLNSSISNLSTTVADLDSSTASSVSSLSSSVRKLDRAQDANAETVLNSVIAGTKLSDVALNTIALVKNELTTKVEEGLLAEATARDLLGAMLSTDIATNAAAVQSEQLARVTADEALATDISTLSAEVVSNIATVNASITAEQTARADADSALATDISTLSATVNSNNSTLSAAIQSESTARADADGALTTQINTAYSAATKTRTYAQATEPTTGMIEGDLWFDANDGYKAYRYTGTQWSPTDDTRIAGNVAAIESEATTRADETSALATSINTLSSTVETNNTTLTTSIQTQAETIDGIQGKYAVKIDNNGYVTGYGLISTNNTGTPTSEFMVVADKFSIAPVATDPATADGSPFFHLTSPTTINGVEVPAGTYMKAAYIHDASITNAKIANAAIDSAKIADAAIVTAKIGDAAITTAKIGDAAITTAKIQDAAITNALIADAQITSAKIADATITSAKIVNAAITSAKIGAAAVDTLNIANNAVTVPVSATGVSSASTASSDFGEQPVAIIAFCGGTFSSPGTSYMRIYRDTTLLATYDFGFGDYYPSYCAVFLDTPTYGSHYYKVEASGPTNWRACGITALGVKR